MSSVRYCADTSKSLGPEPNVLVLGKDKSVLGPITNSWWKIGTCGGAAGDMSSCVPGDGDYGDAAQLEFRVKDTSQFGAPAVGKVARFGQAKADSVPLRADGTVEGLSGNVGWFMQQEGTISTLKIIAR